MSGEPKTIIGKGEANILTVNQTDDGSNKIKFEFDLPIVIISYNRPDLLSQVLFSLKKQSVSFDESKVFLFQDAPKLAFLSDPSTDVLQKQCLSCFEASFPRGRSFYSRSNLGVALNFDRAERYVFEDLKAECALFLEDDLVLSPHYLDAMRQLVVFALAEPLVGYVAAIGDHTASIEDQLAHKNLVLPLTHNWAFALTRRQWKMQREFVDGYLDLIKDVDYSTRDHKIISKYFASYGYAIGGSSQDAAKCVAGAILGTVRLMCYICYGHYLGRQGEHFTEHVYETMRFQDTQFYPDSAPTFEMPGRARLLTLAENNRALLRILPKSVKSTNLSAEIEAEEFIFALYRVLLKRAPDQPGLENWLRAIKSGMSLAQVTQRFVDSKEYTDRSES